MDHKLETAADWLSKTSATSATSTQHHNNNNTLKTNNNHRNSYDPSLKDMVDSNSISKSSAQQQKQHSYQPRRPPEGRENDELQMHAFKTNGEHSTGGGGGVINGVNGGTSTGTATTAAAVIAATTTTNGHGTEAVQIQSSKEATNGKINVQVTVLVGKYTHIHTHPHMHTKCKLIQETACLHTYTHKYFIYNILF